MAEFYHRDRDVVELLMDSWWRQESEALGSVVRMLRNQVSALVLRMTHVTEQLTQAVLHIAQYRQRIQERDAEIEQLEAIVYEYFTNNLTARIRYAPVISFEGLMDDDETEVESLGEVEDNM